MEKAEALKRDNISIIDIDKRAFLKLIGGVGLSLFLLSIFNKRIEGLFSKSLPASGNTTLEATGGLPAGRQGNEIDQAPSQPTGGYKISEIDDNVITFYGFINKDGAWYIMREDTDTGSFRYTKGDFNFPGSWTRRQNLKYDYTCNVFKP